MNEPQHISAILPAALEALHASSRERGAALNVLIGCEYSAEEREAFAALGHNAWSCDILPSEKLGKHLQGDVFDHLDGYYRGHGKSPQAWDLIILHPPCTAMALCGNRWYGRGKPHHHLRVAAWEWTKRLWLAATAACDMVALEQPKTTLGGIIGKHTQAIQPWQFGHPEQKDTWLWLHGLPRLAGTNNVYQKMMSLPRRDRERTFFMSPGKNRGQERARAFPGIAAAMAQQWGNVSAITLTPPRPAL